MHLEKYKESIKELIMSDLNVVALSGRLVSDPEVRVVADTKVCSMMIANNRIVGKNKSEKVVFIDVQSWGGLAEVCSKFLKKGSRVYVSGTLKQDSWEKDGEKKSKIYIEASDVEFGQKASSDSLPKSTDKKDANVKTKETPAAPKPPVKFSEPDEDTPF